MLQIQALSLMTFTYPHLPGIPNEWQVFMFWGLLAIGVLILSTLAIMIFRSLRRKPKLEETPSQVSKPPSLEISEKEEKRKEEQQEEIPKTSIIPLKKDTILQTGLSKTRVGFIGRLAQLLGKKQIDSHVLEQLEEVLFTADVGTKTAQYLFDKVKERLSKDQLAQGDIVFETIREESLKLLEVTMPPLVAETRPFVILVVGVNGVGKTTTIGKLASQFKKEGKHVILAAGDTFRAAAVEQLSVWGDRVGAKVVKGKEGGDPSSVIFDAIKQGQQEQADMVIADTAGRLHVKAQLMEELQKVRRVIKKAEPTAPHETWLVLDATTGQNAIAQATTFKEMVDITGIVLTKLDGTAKGGVILGICHELKVPVRYIGIGEKAEDLRPFDAKAFINALFDEQEATS